MIAKRNSFRESMDSFTTLVRQRLGEHGSGQAIEFEGTWHIGHDLNHISVRTAVRSGTPGIAERSSRDCGLGFIGTATSFSLLCTLQDAPSTTASPTRCAAASKPAGCESTTPSLRRCVTEPYAFQRFVLNDAVIKNAPSEARARTLTEIWTFGVVRQT